LRLSQCHEEIMSETASEQLQGDNLGNVVIRILLYFKNYIYEYISGLILVYDEFSQPMIL